MAVRSKIVLNLASMSTPKLKTTSGIVRLDNKFYIDLELPQSGETNSFYQFLLKNDEHNITICHENSKEWFNKASMSREVIDALFHPMLSYSKDKETGEPDMTKSPTLKVKIPFWENQFNCEVYDTESRMLFPNESTPNTTPLELITKASNISALIQCGGFWFANGKFGITWKLVQCVVKPKPSLKGKCLISLSSEVKKEIEKSNTRILLHIDFIKKPKLSNVWRYQTKL